MTSDVLPPPFERSARLDLWQEELEQESAFIDALIDCADVFEECPDDIHNAVINRDDADNAKATAEALSNALTKSQLTVTLDAASLAALSKGRDATTTPINPGQ